MVYLSLLLLVVWCESNSAHTGAVVDFVFCYLFPCYCWLYRCESNSVRRVTVVCFCLLLSFSLLLLSVWCESNSAHTVAVVYFSLLLLAVWCESNSAHTGTVIYICLLLSFSLLLLAVWCESNSAHTGAVVYSCLLLSFSLLLLAVWCESNSAHTVAVVCFSLLLLAVWCESNSAHTGAVVYSCFLLSFLELSLAGYDVGVRNELLLAVGAFYLFSYRTEGLRIDGNPCPCLLSPPAPAPHSKCLGQSVARFKRPFESRPADPVRRERYLHLALQSGNSGGIPATAATSATPRLLDRVERPSSAHRRGFMCRRRLEF